VRVAPDDDADAARDAVIAHLHTHQPWGAAVTATASGVVQPLAIRTDGRAHAAARAAMADAWGIAPVDIGVGGSIQFVNVIARRFPDAEILITGVEDPDTRAHGANESLHLGEFARACLAEVLLLTRLA
jgi:acetylornithine deacetylase/succinyl-diaminopimelate desuccinylase-like protein